MDAPANTSSCEALTRVFVSYAREDKRWLGQDDRHNLIPFLMESLRRQNVVFWYDKELTPGDEYKKHIEEQINRAQIALLIVSQSFLNSEFIEAYEMPLIANRTQLGQMIIVPVLVEPCDWYEYKFLADRQMVPASMPLIEFTDNDIRWSKVRKEILDGLKTQIKRIRDKQDQDRVKIDSKSMTEEAPHLDAGRPAEPGKQESQAPRITEPPSHNKAAADTRSSQIVLWARPKIDGGAFLNSMDVNTIVVGINNTEYQMAWGRRVFQLESGVHRICTSVRNPILGARRCLAEIGINLPPGDIIHLRYTCGLTLFQAGRLEIDPEAPKSILTSGSSPVENVARSCPRCSQMMPNAALFCPVCGEKQLQQNGSRCIRCGLTQLEGKFCHICGGSLV